MTKKINFFLSFKRSLYLKIFSDFLRTKYSSQQPITNQFWQRNDICYLLLGLKWNSTKHELFWLEIEYFKLSRYHMLQTPIVFKNATVDSCVECNESLVDYIVVHKYLVLWIVKGSEHLLTFLKNLWFGLIFLMMTLLKLSAKMACIFNL